MKALEWTGKLVALLGLGMIWYFVSASAMLGVMLFVTGAEWESHAKRLQGKPPWDDLKWRKAARTVKGEDE